MSENLKKYLEGLEKLKHLQEEGRDEEADQLADNELDQLWQQLSEEDIHTLNGWKE
jgi:hypothetical protein